MSLTLFECDKTRHAPKQQKAREKVVLHSTIHRSAKGDARVLFLIIHCTPALCQALTRQKNTDVPPLEEPTTEYRDI